MRRGRRFCPVHLPFERGIPSHGTLKDVVQVIDAELCNLCFAESVDPPRDDRPDANDGKTSRHCPDTARGCGSLHLVSA